MFKKAFIASLLFLSSASVIAQTAAAADAIALRAEVQQIEQDMYNLFNQLNSDDDFDVRCSERKVTGSLIPDWRCEAAFMQDASSRNVANRVYNPNGGGANMPASLAPQSERQITRSQRRKTEQLNAEMLALARQNPELATLMIALNDKRQQIEALEK